MPHVPLPALRSTFTDPTNSARYIDAGSVGAAVGVGGSTVGFTVGRGDGVATAGAGVVAFAEHAVKNRTATARTIHRPPIPCVRLSIQFMITPLSSEPNLAHSLFHQPFQHRAHRGFELVWFHVSPFHLHTAQAHSDANLVALR